MNQDTTKAELLDKMSPIQDAMQARLTAEYTRLQTWLRERREKIIASETARRQPGILDRIQTCESREAAFLMFHEFLDRANAVSQKTINKANRLLSTLDFPQA
jgi:hypothetical protein